MNTLVVGSNGFLARQLIEPLKASQRQVIEAARSSQNEMLYIDLNSPELFDYEELVNIDEVIFMAAISSPDLCTKQYDSSYKINVTSTAYFIEEALKRDCKVLFFSSDAVYGTNDSQIFNETSIAKPDTEYGSMKKNIEETFKGNPLFKAVRLSYVIAQNDKFTTYWKKCLENQEMVEVFHPFYRNCIFVEEVVEACISLLDSWETINSTFINICGNELISRVEILDQINRLNKDKLKYNILLDNEEFFKSRPRICNVESLYMNKLIREYNLTFYEKLKKYWS